MILSSSVAVAARDDDDDDRDGNGTKGRTSDECVCREDRGTPRIDIDRGDFTKNRKAKEDATRHDDSNRAVNITFETIDLNIVFVFVVLWNV
mmetsp:Transcript_11788/g.17862  ORF Transcript_11788/g.17862 Transcript_11788/m.17862 type:complete len:92 (-) Transcript_11788:36-311(-)